MTSRDAVAERSGPGPGRDPVTQRAVGVLPHVPALDGLRGLAVAAVVVLHAGGTGWLPGGFLGVSLFFTLSGYLIGSLVLAEVEARGRLGLATFWARRVRRLVPPLILLVVGVVVLGRFMDLPSSTRSELWGGLGYVANWVQVASGESYAQLFESPSAATHLWSLAIEEQFYLFFPFLAWLVARSAPGGLRRSYVLGGSVVTVAGVLVASGADDHVMAYYGTHVRAPEIAVGLVLAGLWPMGNLLHGGAAVGAPDDAGPATSPRGIADGVGAVAIFATGALWWTTDLSDEWIYSGGLALVAVVSAGLLVGATAGGPVARLLAIPPLPAVGKVSYGLYLYHWPVVVLLSPPRVDLEPLPLFAVRVVASLGLTFVSYRFVEQPIRRGRLVPDASAGAVIAAGTGALALAALVVWVGVAAPGEGETPERPAPAVVAPGTVDPGSAAAPDTPGTTPASAVPVVAVFGDSLPNWLLRDGGWTLDPADVLVVDATSEGCDGAEGAPVGRAGTGVVVTLPETCTGWRTQYPPVVEDHQVDVALLAVGTGAVLDRRLEGEFAGPCTDVARNWYRTDVAARLRYLADHVGQIVLVLPAWSEEWSGWVNPPDHRERTDCVRATLLAAVEEATASPEVVVVDLTAHLCADGAAACQPVRERDGVHIDPDDAPSVLGWMIDQALEAHR